MTMDSQNKHSKKEMTKHNKSTIMNKKKQNADTDSDSNYEKSDSDNEDIDVHQLRKLLYKKYPSKYQKSKVEAGEKLKNTIKKEIQKQKNDNDDDDDGEDDWDTMEEEESNNKNKRSKKNNKTTTNKKEKEKENKSKKCDDKKCDDKKCDKKDKKDKSKKSKKVEKSDTEDDEDYEDEDYEDDDEDYEDDDDDDDYDEEDIIMPTKSNKVNIIFTIGDIHDEDEEYDSDYDDEYDDDEDYDDDETENEDESVSSSSSSEEEEETRKSKSSKKSPKSSPKKSSSKNKINSTESTDDTEKPTTDNNGNASSQHFINLFNEMYKKSKNLNDTTSTSTVENGTNANETENKNVNDCSVNNSQDFIQKLNEMYKNDKNNKMLQKCISICEEDTKKHKEKLVKKEKKTKDKNLRIFKKIIKDKNTMNDFNFYEKLEVDDQKKIIKEVREINKIIRIEKPYRITLLEADIPTQFKSAAMKKINSLRYMEPGSGEFYKIKNWVDTFMRIPFSNFQTLPLSIDDGVDKCHEFMEEAQKRLDSAVYGLNDAKIQIMQMLGQLITNPKAIGCAVAIHGPPGTGKTSLVKEGISKILNRPFAFIALGGATDSSFLEGHSYTYEGSTWGKIVQILIDSKCMNPVIYFDELDKISDTPRGEEITSILTHLTDTSQNSQFHDKYFAEINFDLSKCLFIFSYNDESKVNPILKDRMYRIQTKGYDQKQKTIIGNDYLLPRIREQIKFDKDDIIIPNETMHHIISNYCNNEHGVRNLKRCLEIIYTKINLYRLMKPDTNLFEQDISLKVQFPFTVTKDIVDKLILKVDNNISAMYSMYI